MLPFALESFSQDSALFSSANSDIQRQLEICISIPNYFCSSFPNAPTPNFVQLFAHRIRDLENL